MENNKSQGSDGQTAEFYRCFWTDKNKYLGDSLNYSFESGKLTQLLRQNILTLIKTKRRYKPLINLEAYKFIKYRL